MYLTYRPHHYNIKKNSFTYFAWVWNLVYRHDRRPEIESTWQHIAEKNVDLAIMLKRILQL